MERTFNDPYLETLRLMHPMSEIQLELLKEYAIKLQSAYAAKAKEQNGQTYSGKA